MSVKDNSTFNYVSSYLLTHYLYNYIFNIGKNGYLIHLFFKNLTINTFN